MGFYVVTQQMVEMHLKKHDMVPSEVCPICARYGPGKAGAAAVGRLVAINAPHTSDTSKW